LDVDSLSRCHTLLRVTADLDPNVVERVPQQVRLKSLATEIDHLVEHLKPPREHLGADPPDDVMVYP
jgi:hypothetical protein